MTAVAPAVQAERLPMPTFSTQAVPPPALAQPAGPSEALRAPVSPSGAATPAQSAAATQRARDTVVSAPSSGLLPPPGAGSPAAGTRVGQDLATPPSLPASAPRLNLELVRPRGGAISAQGGSGLLQMLPHPPEAKSKLAEDIEKAAKADCRKAYGSLGLLAVVPLAADTVRDKGCRW